MDIETPKMMKKNKFPELKKCDNIRYEEIKG